MVYLATQGVPENSLVLKSKGAHKGPAYAYSFFWTKSFTNELFIQCNQFYEQQRENNGAERM